MRYIPKPKGEPPLPVEICQTRGCRHRTCNSIRSLRDMFKISDLECENRELREKIKELEPSQ